jgi:hypothetical protein
MTRRFTFLVAVPALLSVALLASFAEVTFVMKNGERVSGTFSYNHTDHYQLIQSGRERSFPSDDIAMIAFVPGDPSPREVSMLPESGNPPELERHTLVLRSGDMKRGKIYDFKGDQLIMDHGPGDRRTYNFGDIARLYISAPGARNVFRSGSPDVGNVGEPRPGRGRGGAAVPGMTLVRAAGNQPWSDTRVLVNKGDQVRFQATGEVQISEGNMAGPEGKAGIYQEQIFPVRGLPPGALIGKVGANGRPFPIGASTDVIVMPATGTLFLGINDNNFPDNGGGFDVRIQRIGH